MSLLCSHSNVTCGNCAPPVAAGWGAPFLAGGYLYCMFNQLFQSTPKINQKKLCIRAQLNQACVLAKIGRLEPFDIRRFCGTGAYGHYITQSEWQRERAQKNRPRAVDLERDYPMPCALAAACWPVDLQAAQVRIKAEFYRAQAERLGRGL